MKRAMKRTISCLVALVFIFGLSGLAIAGNIDMQKVTFEVLQINEISVSGTPQMLMVVAPGAYQGPREFMDSSTTYSITTNGKNKKITGKIDSPMSVGTVLHVNLAAPKGAASRGLVVLSAAEQDLVTGITKVREACKSITYMLSTTPEVGEVRRQIITVILTVSDAS